MSACLFMVDYSKSSRDDLEKERSYLAKWLGQNKPDPANAFERDRYGGNIFNFKSVCTLIRDMELREMLADKPNYEKVALLAREGICDAEEFSAPVATMLKAYLVGYGEGSFHSLMAIK